MKQGLTDRRMTNATVHESPEIGGSFCNGCLCLEVLTERRGSDEREKYYCNRKRGYFNPLKVDDCEHAVFELERLPKYDYRGFTYGRKNPL